MLRLLQLYPRCLVCSQYLTSFALVFGKSDHYLCIVLPMFLLQKFLKECFVHNSALSVQIHFKSREESCEAEGSHLEKRDNEVGKIFLLL